MSSLCFMRGRRILYHALDFTSKNEAMPIWSLSLPLVPESSDISIISMSLDMLSVCDVAGWSPAYIFFATPSDSRLWRGLPLWPTTPTYHPTFSQVAFSYCHQSTLNLGMLAEKAKLPVNVFGGRISLVKIKKGRGKSRSLHSREWLVCVRWRWRSVLSTLALWLCLTWTELGVNAPPACSSQIYMRMCLGDQLTITQYQSCSI